MDIVKRYLKQYDDETDMIEFRRISKLISELFQMKEMMRIADIGSGLCKFPDYISREINCEVNCMDINPELVALAQSKGYLARQGSILNIPYPDNYFDIVHCSHVIEHLSYPDVIYSIEELFRIVKTGGIVIIRSPLVANHRFYNDIDHVRPYPPMAILNFINNPQQQKVSKIKTKEIERWYTKIASEINYYKYDNVLTRMLNVLFKLMWLLFRFYK